VTGGCNLQTIFFKGIIARECRVGEIEFGSFCEHVTSSFCGIRIPVPKKIEKAFFFIFKPSFVEISCWGPKSEKVTKCVDMGFKNQ
jgi:hypothetical protein